ncbi:putative rho GDP-dissociation inhibitor [Caenorhabditis elegans]|uniref:Probable rho GDP-dissociation inhibitor n=1 Tax=Caenorhabditis elegans TaxID=6239 RepID=GDIR_CAEEL|nr:putative rho GDP-dissociation inhibitor [Caenorhabditis elegans]Q20496.1 RecName: Full=Probable rho GDP-dissociation inhibitor; Short=Rho GDI [Caenorhabditis elegans]CCD63475.1 Probable rho GDP-dissociation inhibitor [Caenorhabditis elegans]|eukprot:NP_508774.1 Probable rho GDP-dissociation inhibitor [Caenorhabditis elegans]
MSDHENTGENTSEYQYKQPPQKSIDELLNADKEDESLKVYKAKLLGQGTVIVDEKNPLRVIVRSVELLINGKTAQSFDLSDPAKLVNSDLSVSIKEGSNYRLSFAFHVQREITSGLHYKHKVKRSGITVENEKYMMGSYAPKLEIQEYKSPNEEAPSGMMHRGKYKVYSKITDDDNNVYLDWQWTLHITKE